MQASRLNAKATTEPTPIANCSTPDNRVGEEGAGVTGARLGWAEGLSVGSGVVGSDVVGDVLGAVVVGEALGIPVGLAVGPIRIWYSLPSPEFSLGAAIKVSSAEEDIPNPNWPLTSGFGVLMLVINV